jgi:dihydroorotase
LKWAAREKLPLLQALSHVTQASADILGIAAGDISINSDADLCLFAADEYWQVTPTALKSQGKNSPFQGLEFAGKVKMTLIHGQVVYQA